MTTLEKIRTEIEQLKTKPLPFDGYDECVKYALSIIDKYAEQEPKSCEKCLYAEETDGSHCYECVKGESKFKAEPCDDVVSRNAVLELLRSDKYDYATIYERVNYLPSIRPQEQTGKWEEIVKEHKCYARDDTYTTTEYHCSKCGAEPFTNEDGFYELSNYCPNCGCAMKGGMVEQKETETWHGIHAQITAPKGTFERIFNEKDDDYDI